MASETEICNLAISHLGSGKEIGDLSTDKSNEASACRRYYEVTRDTLQRDYDWPFATSIATLSLVEEDPNDEWSYSYRYPSDCFRFRRILSGIRNDTERTRVPFKIAYAADGQVVFTDQQDAQAEYSIKVTDPARFSPDFIMALSFRLAAYIAPRITAGDPFGMGKNAMQQYLFHLSTAEKTAGNEEQRDQPVESEFIRERL